MSRTLVRTTFPQRPAMPTRGGVPDVEALIARSRAEFGDSRMEGDDDDARWSGLLDTLQRDDKGNLIVPQAALTRMLTDEKRQGRKSGVKGLLERLSIKDEAELGDLVTKGRAAATAPGKSGAPAAVGGGTGTESTDPAVAALMEQVSQLTARLDADANARKESEQAGKKAARKDKVKEALVAAGVNVDEKKRVPGPVVNMVLGELDDDSDDGDVASSVETIKAMFPAMFEGVGHDGTTTTTTSTTTPAAPSHGGGPTTRTQPPAKAGSLEAGAAVARKRLGLDDKPKQEAGV